MNELTYLIIAGTLLIAGSLLAPRIPGWPLRFVTIIAIACIAWTVGEGGISHDYAGAFVWAASVGSLIIAVGLAAPYLVRCLNRRVQG